MKAEYLTHPLTATRPLARAAAALACAPAMASGLAAAGCAGAARQGRVTGQGGLAGSGVCDIAADTDRRPRGDALGTTASEPDPGDEGDAGSERTA
jgi:hypothetical protein